jgi:hypothetical protein
MSSEGFAGFRPIQVLVNNVCCDPFERWQIINNSWEYIDPFSFVNMRGLSGKNESELFKERTTG